LHSSSGGLNRAAFTNDIFRILCGARSFSLTRELHVEIPRNLTHRIATHCHAMRVVNQPVEDEVEQKQTETRRASNQARALFALMLKMSAFAKPF
jgi:hypothetical protein